MIKNILERVLNRLQSIEHKLNVENIRYANVKDECKKNNIISIIFFILNIVVIILNNFQEYKMDMFSAFVFIVMLVLMVYSSRLWNFSLCPEKTEIKYPVYAQTVVRFVMIASLCALLPFEKYFVAVTICLSVIDIILNIIINIKGRKIVLKNDVSIFKSDISDWEFNNVEKIGESITYGAILLYIIAVNITVDFNVLFLLIIKIYMAVLSVYFINKKLSNAYENRSTYIKKVLIIDIFLIAGFLINFIGLTIGKLYWDVTSRNFSELKEITIMLAILCLFPLCNEYAAIGNKFKKIRYEMEVNNEK